jgi:hypothetical protein
MEKLQNEEIHDLYSSLNTISMIKSRMIRQGSHTGHTVMRNAYKMLVERPEGCHLGYLCIDGMIILKLILKN